MAWNCGAMLRGVTTLTFVSSLGLAQTHSPTLVRTPPGRPESVAAVGIDISRISPRPLNNSGAGLVLHMPPGKGPSSAIFQHPDYGSSLSAANAGADHHPHPAATGNTDGLSTVPTFNGAFNPLKGFEETFGLEWRYTIVGNDPAAGHSTMLSARMVEVSLTLLDGNGKVFQNVSYSPFEQLTLNSPVFEEAAYPSQPGKLQFTDAVQRAEFWNGMKPDWHTELQPVVVDRINMTIPSAVTLRFDDGSTEVVPAYFYGTAPDGSTFVLMLDVLFSYLFNNAVTAEIDQMNFQTNGLNVMLFPNTFLFSLNTSDPTQPGPCCVLGFHTYFFETPVVPQPRWLTAYASWTSPGLFGDFQDITALSHEVAETFNDPFLDNQTSVWQFPGQPPDSTFCQNNLEVGDPIEVLPNAETQVSIKIRGKTVIYHPQSMALRQWFEMGPTSNALNGMFSYPQPVLTQSAIPCPF